jgi:hypothetical protein
MIFCDRHWSDLKEALEERRLSHLVSKTAQEAAFRCNKGGPNNYDPLVRANLMIVQELVKHTGPAILQTKFCPLCEATRRSKDEALPERWIKGCTDVILKDCVARGRMKPGLIM